MKNTWRYYFTPVYKKSWLYDLQILIYIYIYIYINIYIYIYIYKVWQTEIGNHGSFFVLLPTHPPKNTKSQSFEKMRNKEQQSYEVWWWEIFFALIPHYWPQKLKLGKEKPEDIILLNMCTINKDHMVHGYWDKKAQQTVFCHLGSFFALLTLLTTQKIKIL